MKKGRPSKMNESLENVALSLAAKGHIDKEIAEIIGVSESAFNEHKKRNHSFHESLKLVKESFDNKLVEGALLKRATGLIVKEKHTKIVDGKKIVTFIDKELPPDSSALALFLRNRMPEQYCREKHSINFELNNKVVPLSIDEAREILRNDPFVAYEAN